MSLILKYKLIGDFEFSDFHIAYEDAMYSFSTNGSAPVTNTNRRFIAMMKILGALISYLNKELNKSAVDITHIEVVDTRDANLMKFNDFKLMNGNEQNQNLICLDYCETNRNGSTFGDGTNSYFDKGNYPNLQSFVCKYPCLFSPYYVSCFTGSKTLNHISLNLQCEETIAIDTTTIATSSVIIPTLTFNESKIVSFESSTVTHVGSDAFRCCFDLKKVFLPKCTNIDSGGFRACSGLKYLSIPSIKNIFNLIIFSVYNVANIGTNDATIGRTTKLCYLVLPSNYTSLQDDSSGNDFVNSEIKMLQYCIASNNGSIKTLLESDIANYITSNPQVDVCKMSILDIDSIANDISYIVRNVEVGSSEMKLDCFQNISFQLVNGKPINFSFPVPETPIPSLPMMAKNTTIADDFINVTLQKMGVSFSSANASSIVSYKTNLLADINAKIKNMLETQKDIIGDTLFDFASTSERVSVLSDGTGKLNMFAEDKIKFIIRLISGNGVAHDKSYEIVYSLI